MIVVDTAVSVENTVMSVEDTVMSVEDTAISMEDTVMSVEDTAMSMEDIVMSVEDTAMSVEDTVMSAMVHHVCGEHPQGCPTHHDCRGHFLPRLPNTLILGNTPKSLLSPPSL